MTRKIRLSDTGKCQRMRVMKSINHQHGEHFPPDAHSDETLRLFALGNAVEAMEIDHILKTYHDQVPEENIYRDPDLTVQMGPYGPGHPDLFVVDYSIGWLYEIKSSQKPYPEHYHQLKAYKHYLEQDPRFSHLNEIKARLWIAPRHGGLPQEYPVEYSDHDLAVIHSLADAVLQHAADKTLPERICSTPAEGDHRLCQLVTACFDTWVPQQPTDVQSVEIIEALERLYYLQDVKRQYGDLIYIQDEMDQLEASLAKVLQKDTTYQAGHLLVKYSVSDYPSRKYAEAVKAGIDPRDPDAMASFTNISQRIKWTISSLEDSYEYED